MIQIENPELRTKRYNGKNLPTEEHVIVQIHQGNLQVEKGTSSLKSYTLFCVVEERKGNN